MSHERWDMKIYQAVLSWEETGTSSFLAQRAFRGKTILL